MVQVKLQDGSKQEINAFSVMWRYKTEKDGYHIEQRFLTPDGKKPTNPEKRLWLFADSKEELTELAITLIRIVTGQADKEWCLWHEWRKNAEDKGAEGGLHEDRSPKADQHEDSGTQS